MRLFLKIFFAFFLLLVGLLILPFTSVGNAILKPYIQDAITQYSPLPLELTHFSLGFASFDVQAKGEDSVDIRLNGSYSILGLSLDSYLHVDVKDLAYASKILNTDLQGAFVVDVRAMGDMDLLQIVGESNIAHSKTIFLGEIKNLAFSNASVQVENASIPSLLATIAKPGYVRGNLNINAIVMHDAQKGLDGHADVVIADGTVDGALVKRDFAINVPKTRFTTKLLGTFKGENVTHNLTIHSNIGTILTEGTTNIRTIATNSKFGLDVSDLSPLTPLLGMPVRGDLQLYGDIKGDQKSLLIDGDSNLAASKTNYRVHLVDFAPSVVEAKVKSLKLERLLYMLHQPLYTQGSMDLDAILNDFSAGISGEIAINIPNGKIQNAAMQQNFNLDMPTTPYTLKVSSTLHRGSGELLGNFNSSLASLSLNKTLFTLTPLFTLKSPYILKLPDLNRLQFVTGMPMKGMIEGGGNVSVDHEGLRANFLSDMLGGRVDAQFANNILNAKLVNLKSEEILKMLTYDPFFTSSLNGSFDYELLTSRGVLEASLRNGRLSKNLLTTLALPIFGVDLTKEIYQEASLKSFITEGLISSDINLVSKHTSIVSKGAKINTKAQTVDALLTLMARGKATNARIQGPIKRPKISVDRLNQAIDKIKDKATDKINQAIDKNLQKHLNVEQAEDVKNILQNIFKQ